MSADSRTADPWAKRLFAVTLFVDDLEEAKRFYRDVFEMPVVNEDATSCAFRFPNVVINLLTDVLYGVLDPRIRLAGGRSR